MEIANELCGCHGGDKPKLGRLRLIPSNICCINHHDRIKKVRLKNVENSNGIGMIMQHGRDAGYNIP